MKSQKENKRSSCPPLKPIIAFLLMIVIPWGLYWSFHPTNENTAVDVPISSSGNTNSIGGSMMKPSVVSTPIGGTSNVVQPPPSRNLPKVAVISVEPNGPSSYRIPHEQAGGDFNIDEVSLVAHEKTARKLPVLGPTPTNGTKPTFGKHNGKDAIFALACNYPVSFYARFVGTLRKFGFNDDIVLAVSPPPQMKPGVEQYVKDTEVVAYAFDVDCAGKDNCRLKKEFLG